MKYEDFKAVCKWLQAEQVSLDLNEDEIKQEYSLFKAENKAINYTHCCTELPSKELRDSKLNDMVSGYKTICKPDANFEKYYSKGFTECWEWLKRMTK